MNDIVVALEALASIVGEISDRVECGSDMTPDCEGCSLFEYCKDWNRFNGALARLKEKAA